MKMTNYESLKSRMASTICCNSPASLRESHAGFDARVVHLAFVVDRRALTLVS